MIQKHENKKEENMSDNKVEIINADATNEELQEVTAEETSQEEPETEPQADEEQETPAKTAEEQLKTAEEQLQERVDELEDKLLRNAAEFENQKKRFFKRQIDIVNSSNDNLLTEILSVVDNFDRALKTGEENSDYKSLSEGTRLIHSQMSDLLNKYDVKPIEAVGEMFDPKLHEAVMQIESAEHSEGTIVQEISKGYLKGDKVLRHSKVGVSKPIETKNETGQANETAQANKSGEASEKE